MIFEAGSIVPVDDGVEATGESVVGWAPKSCRHLGARDTWSERYCVAFVEPQETCQETQPDRLPVIAFGGGSIGPALDLPRIETSLRCPLREVKGLDLPVPPTPQPKSCKYDEPNDHKGEKPEEDLAAHRGMPRRVRRSNRGCETTTSATNPRSGSPAGASYFAAERIRSISSRIRSTSTVTMTPASVTNRRGDRVQRDPSHLEAAAVEGRSLDRAQAEFADVAGAG